MSTQPVSRQTLQRLPLYLGYLRSLPKDAYEHISATTIAQALGLNQVQVGKDIALACDRGKPRTGYLRDELIADIERFLGYDSTNTAVIVGAGHLGRALMSYGGFKNYGLEIVAAFDSDPGAAGAEVAGKRIFPMEKLPELCGRLRAHIGIITVPEGAAQGVCDMLVEAGIMAVWNFAPVMLYVPDGILVQNVNMAASLAVLSNHLAEKLRNDEKKPD